MQVSHDHFGAHAEPSVAVNPRNLLAASMIFQGQARGLAITGDPNLAIDSWSALPAGMWPHRSLRYEQCFPPRTRVDDQYRSAAVRAFS